MKHRGVGSAIAGAGGTAAAAGHAANTGGVHRHGFDEMQTASTKWHRTRLENEAGSD
jgi:hypothetical protein